MAVEKTDILEYDWRLDGESAKFSVDLALYDRAPDEEHTILAFVGCFSNREGRELTAGELRHIDSFIAKCERKVKPLIGGYIEKATIRQYYFYLASRDDYEKLKTLAERERGFDCRIGGKLEPEWTSYFRILYPDAAKYQTVRNEEQIGLLYERGDSEAPRRLNLHLFFATPQARHAFEEAALQEGFAIGEAEELESGDLPCGIVLHRICALRKRDIDTVTVQAIRAAERFGGCLRYWDCPIVPGRGRG
ncbi:MAG: DUF695 domain-containing protein [Clostridia bacterium]|nr:DUF695 domain-containing protein [Clostridia bacterium]